MESWGYSLARSSASGYAALAGHSSAAQLVFALYLVSLVQLQCVLLPMHRPDWDEHSKEVHFEECRDTAPQSG